MENISELLSLKVRKLLTEFPSDPNIGDMVIQGDIIYSYINGTWIVDRVLNFNIDCDKKVINFIDKFKSSNKEVITSLFLEEGYSYWFARILAERFDGIIMFNNINNYFACKIKNVLYNINGSLSNKKSEDYKEWRIEKTRDSFITAKVMRDCILHLDGFINYDSNTCNGEPLKLYNIDKEN